MHIGNPSYFWLLLLLLIPVLIHLLNLRKVKKVYFSNTDLLHVVKQKQGEKTKWMKILTLVMRCLFLLFLIMSFLDIKKEKEIETSQDRVLIYLDNSLSMGSEADLNSNFHQAKTLLMTAIEAFPESSRFRLITNDFFSDSKRYVSKTELSAMTAGLSTAFGFRSIPDILSRLQNDHDQLLFISDFQSSLFKDFSGLPLTGKDKLLAVKTGREKASNVFIDTTFLSSPYIIDRVENKLNIVIKNQGDSPVSGLVVNVFLNDAFVSTLTTDIDPKRTAKLEITLKQEYQNFNSGKVVIRDGTIPFDDTYYFTLNKNKKLSIIEVQAGGSISSKNIESVFGNDDLFGFKRYNISNIDYTAVEETDVLILNGLTTVSEALMTRITVLRSRGATLIVIPDEAENGSFLQQVTGQPINSQKARDSSFVQKIDFNFFDGVFDEQEQLSSMPYAKPVFKFKYETEGILDIGFGESLVYRLPHLSTYVFSVPLYEPYTNFHQHSLFVPFMYKAVMSVNNNPETMAYRIGDNTYMSKVNAEENKRIFKLINKQTSQAYVPDQRLLGGNTLVFNIPKGILSAGHYYLNDGNEHIDFLAFNYEKEESIIAGFDKSAINKYFSQAGFDIDFYDADNSFEVLKEIDNTINGVHWWKVFVILAMLFLLMEVLILRFYK